MQRKCQFIWCTIVGGIFWRVKILFGFFAQEMQDISLRQKPLNLGLTAHTCH